ncbi:hypothetical protein ES703_108048 [subsurface metagenome]
MNDSYYAIGSFEKDGKIIFEYHLWNNKEQAEKVYNSLKKSYPNEKYQLHGGFFIESINGEKFYEKWKKTEELCKETIQKAKKGKLSIEEILKKIPEKIQL